MDTWTVVMAVKETFLSDLGCIWLTPADLTAYALWHFAEEEVVVTLNHIVRQDLSLTRTRSCQDTECIREVSLL